MTGHTRRDRTLLLLGATGNLGSQVGPAFSQGWNVVSPGRDQLDLTNRNSIARALKRLQPQAVVNAAAFNDVDGCEDKDRFALARAINGEGPGHLAEMCGELDLPLVHFSSEYVFSGDQPEGYLEGDEASPISRYGESKALGEERVLAAGGRAYICRVSRIFGPRGPSPSAKPSFVAVMLGLARTKDALRLVNEEVGSPTYTVDIASACRVLLEEDHEPGIYHLANEGPGVTWYEFGEEFFALAGVSIPRTPVPASAFPPRPAARPKHAQLLTQRFPWLRPRNEALREFLSSAHAP